MVTESADLGIVLAIHYLGSYYFNQWSNKAEVIRGLGLWVKAVEMGFLPSMSSYGELLCEEDGCLEDRTTGSKLIKVANEFRNIKN
jgi:hypothetical protein